MKRVLSVLMAAVLVLSGLVGLSGCGGKNEETTVRILTSAEDYRVEHMQKRLNEEFPDYTIEIEYMSTGSYAAKLLSEGTETDCDIAHSLEYGYLEKLAAQNVFADLSELCDYSIYMEDTVVSSYFIPELRNGGAIILSPDRLAEFNLPVPTSYEDLLDPQYKGHISMPNPKSSGTGYMFYKNLVNAWGEEKALDYFDKLTPNMTAGYTSSGSGPVNALLMKEAAIGLGMTAQAVTKMNEENANLQIVFFDEGSPFSLYGHGIIAGKETRPCVKEVFEFLYNTYNYETCENFYPEKVYKDKDYVIDKFPQNIVYGDMSNDTADEKERLLAKWKY